MSKKYVVFWLPTIFHKKLEAKKNKVVDSENDGFFDVSDDSCYPYFVKFELVQEKDDKINIIISSKVTVAEKEVVSFDITLTSEYYQKRKNGFIQFSFEEDEIPIKCKKSFEENLTSAIYHKIKEFYHEHECDTGKDSDLRPEITDEPIPLESDNNSAIVKFLMDFSKLFCKNAESVSWLNKMANEHLRHYRRIRQNISKLSEVNDITEFYQLHNEIIGHINVLNSLLENSLIEYTYCKTLLSSIYNKSFKHDVLLDKENAKEDAATFDLKNSCRREALNIRNSIRYIENIKYKNQNRQYELLHISNRDIREITTKVQEQNDLINKTLHSDKKWQRIGISLAVYGALSSLLFGFRTEIDAMSDTFFGVSLISLTSLLIVFMFFDIPKYFKRLFKSR